MPVSLEFVAADDGTRLAVAVRTPDGGGPFAAVLQVTSTAARGWYDDALFEAGFAVVTMHRRGTGASGGTNPIDHGATTRTDLAWIAHVIAAQPWSTGAVGVLGHGEHATDALMMSTGI